MTVSSLTATRRTRLDVTFVRFEDGCARWDAVRGTGGRIAGAHMPIGRGRIPHDLAHLAVEATLGLPHGVWGLLAQGATYRHGTGQRRTRSGLAVVARHRASLAEAEGLGNDHHARWIAGAPTPVAPAFDRLAAAWDALSPGESLVVRWPTLELLGAPEA